MVDLDLSYLSMEIDGKIGTSAPITIADAASVDFLNITKRGFAPELPDPPNVSQSRYDLIFASTDGGAGITVENDGVQLSYNTENFDNNNEQFLANHLDFGGNVPLFFNVLKVMTRGPQTVVDVITSTTGTPVSNIDCLVKRIFIDDDFASSNPNPFFSQSLPTTLYGMASNPVWRADKIIAYDFIMVFE